MSDGKVVEIKASLDTLAEQIKHIEERISKRHVQQSQENVADEMELLNARRRLVKELESRKLGLEKLTEGAS